MAPVIAALHRRNLPVKLIGTGQHHTWNMMGSFLESFGLHVDHQLMLEKRDLMGSFVEIVAGLGKLFSEHKPGLVLS